MISITFWYSFFLVGISLANAVMWLCTKQGAQPGNSMSYFDAPAPSSNKYPMMYDNYYPDQNQRYPKATPLNANPPWGNQNLPYYSGQEREELFNKEHSPPMQSSRKNNAVPDTSPPLNSNPYEDEEPSPPEKVPRSKYPGFGMPVASRKSSQGPIAPGKSLKQQDDDGISLNIY